MTSQQLIQTLLLGKKKKLRFILDWIDENCDQHQKEEVNKVLGEYDFLVTFTGHGFQRSSHSIDTIEKPPSTDDINYQLSNEPREKVRRKLMKEIDTRKQLVNGLIMEMEELQHQLEEVQTQ